MGKKIFAILCILFLQIPVYSAQVYYGITGHPINAAARPHTRYKVVKYDITGRPAYTGSKPAAKPSKRSLRVIKYNIAGIPVNQVGQQRSQIGVNNKSSKTTSSCGTKCANKTVEHVKPINVRDRRVGSKIPHRVAVNCRGLVQYRNGKPLCGVQ